MSVPSDLDPLDQGYDDDSIDSPPPEIVYPQQSSSSSSVNLNSLNDVFFESRLAHGDTGRGKRQKKDIDLTAAGSKDPASSSGT